MKTMITAAALALFTMGASTAALAQCNKACDDGFTYNSETGSCVKKTVSS